MKSTCLSHPKNEPLILIRRWQYEFCEGNTCAAALMSFFEYWHSYKLDTRKKNMQANAVAKAHGDAGDLDTDLYQFHSGDELQEGIFGIGKENKIRAALKFLESRGVITVHRNPCTRYHFDNTKHFLFHPEVCEQWMHSSKIRSAPLENQGPSLKNQERSLENQGTIPETSPETSAETSTAQANTSQSNREGEIEETASSDKFQLVLKKLGCVPQLTGDVPELRQRIAQRIAEKTMSMDMAISDSTIEALMDNSLREQAEWISQEPTYRQYDPPRLFAAVWQFFQKRYGARAEQWINYDLYRQLAGSALNLRTNRFNDIKLSKQAHVLMKYLITQGLVFADYSSWLANLYDNIDMTIALSDRTFELFCRDNEENQRLQAQK